METCQPYDTIYGHHRRPSATYLLLQSCKYCHRQVKHLRDMFTGFTIRQCYALHAEPPALQAVHYGWLLDVGSKLLLPITITADISPLPLGILKMVRCGCSSERPYWSARCSCAVAQLSCSIFCAGHKTENYCNQRSHTDVASVNGDEEDEDD